MKSRPPVHSLRRLRGVPAFVIRHSSSRLRRLAREERGAALAFTIAVFLFLFVLCLSVYSVGETIRRKTELQDACDAAAYSAAVVQADALSRMAVVNRAMAWSYIQMTKAELDYHTYLWLECVRDNYKHDSEKCLKVYKKDLPPFNNKCGWWHSKYNPLQKYIASWAALWNPYNSHWYWAGFDCHTHFHDNPNNKEIRWIGLGPEGDKYNHIRIGYMTGGELEWNGSDLCIPGSSQGLVESLKPTFGEHGSELRKVIDGFQKDIISCNQLLYDICEKMKDSIPETVRRTLLENLPRTASGEIDESILDQYRYACVGGISAPPPDYGDEGDLASGNSAGNADVTRGSYFSGVRNVEEDELRFLNMADGLPEVRTGPNATVTLKDYFADPDSELSAVRDIAGGLDQWFIRCLPAETANSGDVSINRQPQYAIPGIVRCYKNANYDEGRSTGSIAGSVAGKFNADVHRGNHILPSVSNAMNFGGINFSSLLSTGPAPYVPKGGWSRSVRRASRRVRNAILSLWNQMVGKVSEIALSPVNSLINSVVKQIASCLELDIDPSCKNEQSSFADQCSNVEETHGLVAEYEWKTAAWICGWVRTKGGIVPPINRENGSVIACFHIPVPIGLLNGSCAKSHYSEGMFPWFGKEMKNFKGNPKGLSRNDYRCTFVGLDTAGLGDGKSFFGCRGANQILRGYTRIYGDDRELMPYFITDKIPARPWMLNEKFFSGAGTVVVAVAKEQRNVFDWLADAVSDDKGIHSAFSPKVEGDEEGQPVYYVAMAAGRAGPAPRTGRGRAEGADTDNAGVRVPHYQVAWDAVTDRTLNPRLAKGDARLRSALETEFRKQGYDMGEIEEAQRLGCACGEEETDRRLARQWNLSQADWDGMLLPLRHAFSATASTNDTGLARAKDPVWNWNETAAAGEDGPTGIELVYSTLRDIDWRRFDSDETASETTKELVGGEAFNLPLLRRRRIL